MRPVFVVGLAAIAFAGSAIAGHGEQTKEDRLKAAERYLTGAAPIAHDDYNRLPKLGKFRAWLPKKVDLSGLFPLPGDQAPVPNCTAWATTYAGLGYLHGLALGHQPEGPDEELSPDYVYNRLRPPGSSCTLATRIVDALNLLKSEGTVTFAEYSSDPAKCTVPVPPSMVSMAASQRLGSWRAIERETPNDWRTPVVIDDIKGALSRNEPVVFAMPVVADFILFEGSGIYTHATPENRNWHAMALVGYDEDKQAFRLINSWGRKWGDHGYAWISYDTFKRLAGEAYALQPASEAPVDTGPRPGETPRQVLDDLVAKVPCGEAKLGESGGHLSLSGFAGSEDALAKLRNAAFAVDPGAIWSMDYHPWPQCEAETTLATPLASHAVTLQAQMESGEIRTGDPVAMKAGEKFGIAAETSADKPWLSIVYIQADGSAVELYRGKPDADATGHRRVSIGTGGPHQVRFQVGPPFGAEMVIAIASARPFFGDELTTYSTERQFLSGLRTRLTQFRPDSLAAAALRIQTGS